MAYACALKNLPSIYQTGEAEGDCTEKMATKSKLDQIRASNWELGFENQW